MKRFFRLSLSTRLFLAVLAVAAAAVIAAGIASHRSFQHGFLGYLNQLAIDRMESAMPRLTAAYARHGSWDFLREEPRQWIDIMVRGDEDRQRGRPPVSDLTGAFLRVTLLDTNHAFVMGYHGDSESRIERAVRVNDRVVGWLSLTPFQTVSEAGAVRFEQAQLRARWTIFSAAIVLAAAIAWWVSLAVLGPVRSVARATHELAGGDYTRRVPELGDDEVGRLSRDFNHLAATLERNEAMRRGFMADVAHELRTPLGVLHGELEAVEDGIRPLDLNTVKTLQGEVRQLNKLVSDLYDLALTDVGALAYRKENIDLTGLVAEACAGFSPRLAAQGLTLETALPDAPLQAFADPSRIRQLLANLLENACRYTDAGGQVRVSLAAVTDSTRRSALQLCCEDSAPGVPPDHLTRLFDRFHRVEASRNRASGGAGLGLSICRNIVQAHDGSIEAAASPLGGLAITIRLPAEGKRA
ncbi:ATP-binding protein [Uliginosibacterium paludis]|uniref:histidine kinase n=1 Tax=Uliginosibacterium paludis TaxID=1615952 RepID=A0ABV2CM67_9RHOO